MFINMIQNLKQRLDIFLEKNNWVYLAPLFFSFSLVPYRVLLFWDVEYQTRVVVGGCFFLVFFIFKNTLIPFCLNRKTIQFFFQQGLEIENFLCGLELRREHQPDHYWDCTFYIYCFYHTYVLLPIIVLSLLFEDLFFALIVYLIVYSQYIVFRKIFLTPEFHFYGMEKIQSPAVDNLKDPLEFKWENVSSNINFVSLHFFSKPVINRLSRDLSSRKLPNISVRYMGGFGDGLRTAAKAFFETASKTENVGRARVVVGTAVTTTCLVGGTYFAKKTSESNERMAQAAEASAQAAIRSADYARITVLQNQRSQYKPGSPEYIECDQEVKHGISVSEIAERNMTNYLKNQGKSNFKAPSTLDEPYFFETVLKKINNFFCLFF